MFRDEYSALANGAKAKVTLLEKNLPAYLIMSMLAGLYIGFGSVLMGVTGGALAGQPAQKIVCGFIFSVGLCMVVMAGAELFTGNNLAMAAGALKKTITWGQAIKLWVVCYLGNLIGSIFTGVMFQLTGIGQSNEAIGQFFANAAASKAAGDPLNLFTKAILCNILVCLAIWCCTKMKTEGAKLVLIFCCVGTFVTCGFEHSIANMTFFTIGLLNPMGQAITLGGAFYNLLIVTIGNMIGGIVFVALPYYLVSKEK